MLQDSTLKQIKDSIFNGNKYFDAMTSWESEVLKEFKQQFQIEYSKQPEVLFIERLPATGFGIHLRIGLATEALTASEVIRANKFARKIVTSKQGINNCLQVVVADIPLNAELILFDEEQAYTIACALTEGPHSFDCTERIYLALFELLAEQEYTPIDRLLEIFLSFADHCVKSHQYRKGREALRLCVDTLSELAVDIVWKEKFPNSYPQKFVSFLKETMRFYICLESPEEALTLASQHRSTIKAWEKKTGHAVALTLDSELDAISKHARDLQREIRDFNLAANAAFGLT